MRQIGQEETEVLRNIVLRWPTIQMGSYRWPFHSSDFSGFPS